VTLTLTCDAINQNKTNITMKINTSGSY